MLKLSRCLPYAVRLEKHSHRSILKCLQKSLVLMVNEIFMLMTLTPFKLISCQQISVNHNLCYSLALEKLYIIFFASARVTESSLKKTQRVSGITTTFIFRFFTNIFGQLPPTLMECSLPGRLNAGCLRIPCGLLRGLNTLTQL